VKYQSVRVLFKSNTFVPCERWVNLPTFRTGNGRGVRRNVAPDQRQGGHLRCTILLQSLNIEIRICYGGTRPWQRRPGGVQSGDLSRNCWIDARLDASKGFREIPGSALIRYLDSMVKIAQRVDSTSKLDRLGRWIKFRGSKLLFPLFCTRRRIQADCAGLHV